MQLDDKKKLIVQSKSQIPKIKKILLQSIHI